MICQALRTHKNTFNLNKGYVLWTLLQLCDSQETLPESCILPIGFKTLELHHAAGGFADVWKNTYEGRDLAFKALRRSPQVDDATRLKRKVRSEIFPRQGTPATHLYRFRGGFVER